MAWAIISTISCQMASKTQLLRFFPRLQFCNIVHPLPHQVVKCIDFKYSKQWFAKHFMSSESAKNLKIILIDGATTNTYRTTMPTFFQTPIEHARNGIFSRNRFIDLNWLRYLHKLCVARHLTCAAQRTQL